MSILSIEHVQVAIPVGSEKQAREFYAGILGFQEVAKPAEMAERKSLWFVAGQVHLHLGLEPEFQPAKRAHPAFIVDALDENLAAFNRARIIWKPDTCFGEFRRIHVFDPFGNRLELMERVSQ